MTAQDFHVDQFADAMAQLARDIRALEKRRDALRARAGQTADPKLDLVAEVAELDHRLDPLIADYRDKFGLLEPVIRKLSRRAALRMQVDQEDLSQEVSCLIFEKLATYSSSKSPLEALAEGNQFIAWARTCARNAALTIIRRSDQIRNLQLDYDVFDADDTGGGVVRSRAAADAFTPEEEDSIGTWSSSVRALLLFSSGLWPLVSKARRQEWQGYPVPSDWHISQFCANDRANAFAQDWAEQSAEKQADDSDETIESLERRIRGRVAQNLLRHYWRLFELETAWSNILGAIPMADAEDLQRLEQYQGHPLFAKLLCFDAWIALDTAERWKHWRQQVGVKDIAKANFLRVAAAPRALSGDREGSSSSGLSPHSARLKEIGRLLSTDLAKDPVKVAREALLASLDIPLGEPTESRVVEPEDQESPDLVIRRVLQLAAASRRDVDLPVPFRYDTSSSTRSSTPHE